MDDNDLGQLNDLEIQKLYGGIPEGGQILIADKCRHSYAYFCYCVTDEGYYYSYYCGLDGNTEL